MLKSAHGFRVHQLPRVLVGAPDSLVDARLPQAADTLRRQEQTVLVLHHGDVDPLEIRVVVRPRAVGQGGHVVRDVAGLADVLHLVGQAVEVAQDLAQQAAPDFVPQHVGRQIDRLRPGKTTEKAQGPHGLEEKRVSQSHGAGSSICPLPSTRVTSRSAATFSKTSVPPPTQRTSMRSALVRLPRPKCRRIP